MSDSLDAILRRVAAGELTPEEALPLIDAAKGATAGATPEWGTPPTAPPGTPGAPETPAPGARADETPVRAVRIAISYRSVDVVADPTVAQVTVSGGHTVRREGDVLIVESLQMPGFVEFESSRDWSAEQRGPWSFIGLPRSTAWARSMKGEHVTVRVNPSLPLEIDSAASALRVVGCEGGARIRLVAASLKVDRLRGPLEIDAITSSVKGTAAITGTSRIAGESSSVKLSLLPGSDFRATAGPNRLGKVVLPGTPTTGPTGQAESVVGTGEGTLFVEGVMSSVVLSSDAERYRATA